MKKVLVLAEDYPNNEGGVSLMYIHTRNLYYLNNGIEVTVLNFRSKNNYIIDNISVISYDTFLKQSSKFDTLILHAPNLKNHYRFLIKHSNKFSHKIYFFHGHEVMRITKSYPKPYDYIKNNIHGEFFQDLYDRFKLLVWKNYLQKNIRDSHFVFVSKWMKDEFYKWTKIPYGALDSSSSIIYNCVGKEFEQVRLVASDDKEFDFVTIRSNLDGSKYCIDIVNECAKRTPDAKFLVIGKGEFFKFNEQASNLEWRNKNLSHDDIIKVLSKCKFALMPTRIDAQGLMMCEMVATGMPLITSRISVCEEVFGDFSNVFLIDNQINDGLNLQHFISQEIRHIKDERFTEKYTLKREVDLINKF